MKKKILTIVAAVMVLVMTACGGTTEDPKDASSVETTSTEAQKIEWPEKAIQIVVPYAAGGDTDYYARTTAKYLEKELGQNVVVVNTTGANGSNAAISVLDAANDGYTILFGHQGTLFTQAAGSTPFSYLTDFDTVGNIITDGSYTLVASKELGFTNIQEMVSYAKENPGQLRVPANQGTVSAYTFSKIQKALGIDLKEIEGSNSAAEKLAAVLGGQYDMFYANYNLLKDYVANGDFIVMGAMGEDVPTMPELKTFKDQGYDMIDEYNFMLRVKAGTNTAIVSKLADALKNIAENEDFAKEVAQYNGYINFKSGEDSLKYQQETLDSMTEFVNAGK